MEMISDRPKRGDRYVVSKEFPASVLVQWAAPFTSGGGERQLPAGLEFVVLIDPPARAIAAAARPDPYEEWEPILVDKRDREAEKYAGYYVVISLEHLASHCQQRS